jgi:translation initiation factor 2 subunit 3
LGIPPIQPEINIGTLGHVDNGKSTLVQAMTGVWTSKHSEELRRGITIRIGYADAHFFKCPSHRGAAAYTSKKKCPICGEKTKFLRNVSFIDCPGHHSLMVTMLSGAALMDGALFVVAADAKFPQAQDREHLLAAEMAGIKKMIIVQNKIDVVDRKRAIDNMKEIKKFIKGRPSEKASIIPVSAQHGVNIDLLIESIEKELPTPKRNPSASPQMYVLRSFDINKPGTKAEELRGGVVGGSIVQGVFKQDDKIEIRPGLRVESGGKTIFKPIYTEIRSLHVSEGEVKEVGPGGLVGLGTSLCPSVVKADSLVGSIIGKEGDLPPVLDKVALDVELFEKAVGTEELVTVEKIRTNEPLVLNVSTAVTAGVVTSAREHVVEIALKRPICAAKNFKAAISRRIGDSWRLIGYGNFK